MNEEEKKAINNMKLFARVHQDMTVVTARDMDNVLNLVEKLQKENEKLNNRCRNLDKEAQGYFEKLVGDDTLSTRTIKQLQEENKTLKEFKKYVTDIESTNFVKYKNYIPVQKIKDKIEELKQLEFNNDLVTQSTANLTTICILQELIEERG